MEASTCSLLWQVLDTAKEVPGGHWFSARTAPGPEPSHTPGSLCLVSQVPAAPAHPLCLLSLPQDLAAYYGRRLGGDEEGEGAAADAPVKTDYEILREAYRCEGLCCVYMWGWVGKGGLGGGGCGSYGTLTEACMWGL